MTLTTEPERTGLDAGRFRGLLRRQASTVTVVTCSPTSMRDRRPSRREPERALPSCITSRTLVRVVRSDTTLPSTTMASVTKPPSGVASMSFPMAPKDWWPSPPRVHVGIRVSVVIVRIRVVTIVGGLGRFAGPAPPVRALHRFLL